MYRHLLVPVDGTALSIELVANAVGLARPLGARVSFLHLRPDDAPPSLARERLAKAEAAARACGVPFTSLVRTGPDWAMAIADAARETGCDLIVMAAHVAPVAGGTAPEPGARDVLRQAGLPVLVTRTGELSALGRAIGVLRDEHRSLAAALHVWLQALAAARAGAEPPDPGLMRSIVRFLHRFAVALHHPKEEVFLFRRLRERAPALAAELDELERQHARDHQWLADLSRRVNELAMASGTEAMQSLADLADAVGRYAEFTWDHLGREEGVVLPAAQRHLQATDWAEIDAAFADRESLRAVDGTEEALDRHFARIVGATVPEVLQA
jgi:hemerythrin-like domain-containing protein/nucleotide-binding universal stress UspA family protein